MGHWEGHNGATLLLPHPRSVAAASGPRAGTSGPDGQMAVAVAELPVQGQEGPGGQLVGPSPGTDCARHEATGDTGPSSLSRAASNTSQASGSVNTRSSSMDSSRRDGSSPIRLRLGQRGRALPQGPTRQIPISRASGRCSTQESWPSGRHYSLHSMRDLRTAEGWILHR